MEGRERKEYLTCLLQLPAADGVPPNLHLSAREQPASDKGSRLENDVWREGVWRKEVELKRGRTSEETLREGKRSGTRGGYYTARNKESGFTNGLAVKTGQTN